MIKVTIEIPGESYHFSGAPQEAIDAIRGMMGKEPEKPKEDPLVTSIKAALWEQYQHAKAELKKYEQSRGITYTSTGWSDSVTSTSANAR